METKYNTARRAAGAGGGGLRRRNAVLAVTEGKSHGGSWISMTTNLFIVFSSNAIEHLPNIFHRLLLSVRIHDVAQRYELLLVLHR